MKKISLFAAALAMLSMSVMSCSSAATESKTTDAAEDTTEAPAPQESVEASAATGEVINLEDDAKFTPDTKVDKLTILDFNAVWCVPCKKLTVPFENAAKNFAGKVDFYSVDIDKNPETATAFKVQSVPTVVFLSPNAEPQTLVSLAPFVGNLPGNAEPAQFTEAITNSLSEMIINALK